MQPVQGKKESEALVTGGRPLGLWREGNLLVIDLARHHFPARCVKTNQPVSEPLELLAISCHHVPWVEREFLKRVEEKSQFSLGVWIAEIEMNDRSRTSEVVIRLRLPLAPRWRSCLESKLGQRLVVAGSCTLLAYSVLYLFVLPYLVARSEMILVSSLVLAGCFGGIAAGLVINQLQRHVLPVCGLEGRKLWLGGIHRRWLQDLPEYVPSQDVLERRLWEQGPRLWLSFAVCAIFFGLVLMCHAMRLQSEPLVRGMIAVYLLGGGVGILSANHARQRILQLKQQRRRYYPETDVATFRRNRSQQNA